MPSNRPRNLAEVLAGGVGDALEYMGQVYPAMQQQKRDNTLSMLMAKMRVEESNLSMEEMRQRMHEANRKSAEAIKLSSMTDEERGQAEARKQHGYISEMTSLGFPQAPEGYTLDVPGFSLEKTGKPNALESMFGLPVKDLSLTDMALLAKAEFDPIRFLAEKTDFTRNTYGRQGGGITPESSFRIGEKLLNSKMTQIDKEIATLEKSKELVLTSEEQKPIQAKIDALLADRAEIQKMIADSSKVMGERALGAQQTGGSVTGWTEDDENEFNQLIQEMFGGN